MPTEVALFWGVLAAFVLADNLVLVPSGGDCLRFGWRGRLRYEPAARLQARGRDLVLLNPLNPFDRIALTPRAAGLLSATPLRVARRRVRRALPALNLASCLGCVYGVGLLALFGLSFVLHFGTVLVGLVALHLFAWFGVLAILLWRREALGVAGWPAVVLAAEALFVPAYTFNLGKRAWYKQRLELPAMTLGLRSLARMPQGPARALYLMQMNTRLEDVMIDLGLDADPPTGPEELLRWARETRQCLTTSAPPAGW